VEKSRKTKKLGSLLFGPVGELVEAGLVRRVTAVVLLNELVGGGEEGETVVPFLKSDVLLAVNAMNFMNS